MSGQESDLIILVADGSMRKGLDALLNRPRALGIRPVTWVVDVLGGGDDPGIVTIAHEYLRPSLKLFNRALIVLDFKGCGKDHRSTSEEITADLQKRLDVNGWRNHSAVIMIVPEFDVWVWSDSPHVERALGWSKNSPPLRDWLRTKGFLEPSQTKPHRPKEARRAAMRFTGTRESSAIFEKLGSSVSVKRCTDPAFQLLLVTLREWFPPA